MARPYVKVIRVKQKRRLAVDAVWRASWYPELKVLMGNVGLLIIHSDEGPGC